jgi:putative transposase
VISARERADIELMVCIRAIHQRSPGTYGAPNIHAKLADDHGIRIGRKRVARLMRAAGFAWCDAAPPWRRASLPPLSVKS